MYSSPGKPFIISVEKETPGISCEFIIATMSDGGSTDSSSVPTRWNTQPRQASVQRQSSAQREQSVLGQTPAQREEPMVLDTVADVRWGLDREVSPARGTIEEEGDLYGEPIQMEDDEEIPPTQQDRYQGIFDS
jgi:hypothetical protein